MLQLRDHTLYPMGVDPSMVDFIQSNFLDEDGTQESGDRFIVYMDVHGTMKYYEGYLYRVHTGELCVKPKMDSYARSVNLYAWDRTLAIIPSNKQCKKIWVHPDIDAKMQRANFGSSFYQNIYEKRLRQCLKNLQQI